MNIVVKILYKILEKQIQQHKKEYIIIRQGLFQEYKNQSVLFAILREIKKQNKTI